MEFLFSVLGNNFISKNVNHVMFINKWIGCIKKR